MPNKPDPDKQLVGMRIPRTLYARICKEAKVRKMTPKDYILWLCDKNTRQVVLIPEDFEKIIAGTKAAEERNRRR